MHTEHRVTVAAPPKVVFEIYEDVAHWHTWDPDTRQACLEGPFQVGSRGRLTPAKGRTVPIVVTHLERDRSFTVESRIPLFRMLFEHELTPASGGTKIVHRVTFSGPLAMLLGPMLCRQLNAGLPVTLGRLKALAEARSVA